MRNFAYLEKKASCGWSNGIQLAEWIVLRGAHYLNKTEIPNSTIIGIVVNYRFGDFPFPGSYIAGPLIKVGVRQSFSMVDYDVTFYDTSEALIADHFEDFL